MNSFILLFIMALKIWIKILETFPLFLFLTLARSEVTDSSMKEKKEGI